MLSGIYLLPQLDAHAAYTNPTEFSDKLSSKSTISSNKFLEKKTLKSKDRADLKKKLYDFYNIFSKKPIPTPALTDH